MLKLVKLTPEYKRHLFEMMDEWTASGEKIIPYAIRKNDCREDFDLYMAQIELVEPMNGLVPDSTFFALDTERDIFVGAVNIRHYLSGALLIGGGHIGSGVRPSERGKGYGTKMVALALEECKTLGIDRVLAVCNKSNIASAKTILKNGGVLEDERDDEGTVIQRYWIDNK